MTSLMHLVVDNYNEIIVTKKDPMVDSWLLMGSPIPLLIILGSYLYFVLKLGPAVMAHRKPINLQGVMIVYNFYQVIFSMWLASQPFERGALYHILTHVCHPGENNAFVNQLSRVAWWYFFSKVVELLDTVFFVLRKKQNQVTFLHVYHHTITAFFSWAYLKFLPGEQGIIIGFLNSAVHVFMYSYYLLAALGPRFQKFLWWKKYMTWIQLGQFCIMLTYLLGLLAFDCNFPKALTLFFMGNASIFLYLFFDFYRKAYKKKA